jgi:hypothetical protein
LLAAIVAGLEAVFLDSIFYAARLFRPGSADAGLLYLGSGVFGVIGTLLLGLMLIGGLGS